METKFIFIIILLLSSCGLKKPLENQPMNSNLKVVKTKD